MNAVMKPRRRTIRACAQVDTEVDVEISIDDLVEQLDERDIHDLLAAVGRPGSSSLNLVYEHFALHGGAPQVLKDYIYDTLGRILP